MTGREEDLTLSVLPQRFPWHLTPSLPSSLARARMPRAAALHLALAQPRTPCKGRWLISGEGAHFMLHCFRLLTSSVPCIWKHCSHICIICTSFQIQMTSCWDGWTYKHAKQKVIIYSDQSKSWSPEIMSSHFVHDFLCRFSITPLNEKGVAQQSFHSLLDSLLSGMPCASKFMDCWTLQSSTTLWCHPSPVTSGTWCQRRHWLEHMTSHWLEQDVWDNFWQLYQL